MQMMWDGEASVGVLTTTVASVDDARRLAREAVSQQLAACVQIAQIESHYVWKGEACSEPEWRVVFKTTRTGMAALSQWLTGGAHPYELPQLLMREEAASLDYARWVQAQLQPVLKA